MALGTLGAALASAAVTTGASFLGSKLFGGGSKAAPPPQVGINAGGLSGVNGTLTPTAERMRLVEGVQGAFGDQADAYGGLRRSLAPGFSDLRASRLAEVENARSAAIGNLRDNMARRRVLGSSFGADALARAEKEFGQERDRVASETLLQEIEGTARIIDMESTARRGQFQAGLDEMNLQADLAAKLSGAAATQMGAAARLETELAAKSAAGAGKFFGETFKPVGDAVGAGAAKVASWPFFSSPYFGAAA